MQKIMVETCRKIESNPVHSSVGEELECKRMMVNSMANRMVSKGGCSLKKKSGTSYLDRLNELIEIGWDEGSASQETYAEFFPDRYDSNDYEDG